ncbi:MAG: GNAT family N-acetyltransferase [Alcanivoracaceae bacterium]|nr:GNAT family N-acetyltransferase [Alcanivoracaceae bacterium]
MKIFNSTRLSYQLMDANDFQLLYELDQDPEVMKYINGGKPTTKEDIEEVFLPRIDAYTNSPKGWGLWKVTINCSAEFIGWILVRPMDFFSNQPQLENLELGWRFIKKSWAKGYATEAAQHIMQALIKNRSATQFSAIAVSDNLASIAIMKKLGMRFQKKDIHKDPLGDMLVEYYSLNV